MLKGRFAKVAVALVAVIAMMGAEGGCEEQPRRDRSDSEKVAPVSKPRTAWVEVWVTPDGPFSVAMLGVDKSRQVKPQRFPAHGGTEPVARGHWRYAVRYTSGVPFHIEVNAFAGTPDSIITAKIWDGGHTSTRKARGSVTLEWKTVQ